MPLFALGSWILSVSAKILQENARLLAGQQFSHYGYNDLVGNVLEDIIHSFQCSDNVGDPYSSEDSHGGSLMRKLSDVYAGYRINLYRFFATSNITIRNLNDLNKVRFTVFSPQHQMVSGLR